jgi:hypothetical protein
MFLDENKLKINFLNLKIQNLILTAKFELDDDISSTIANHSLFILLGWTSSFSL